MANLLKGTSGQTLVDRVTAAKHTLSGAGLAKSVCKATTEEIIAPKRKHLEDLVNYTNEPNISIPQMANHLIDRTMNNNWVVVYKSLVTVHHLMCYGNERFTQYLATNNCAFQLNNFLDRSSSAGYEMSVFIKRYANYLNEKAISYRLMGFDFCKIKRGKEGVLRTMNSDKLVKTLPVLQNQLDSLINFNCSPSDITNSIINNCFILLFRDLVRLFACYNDGTMNLLESFWTMNKKQCKEALELYKQFLIRMDKVSEFLRSAEAAGIDKSDIPDITKIPSSLLESMEQHLQYTESMVTANKKDKKVNLALSSAFEDVPNTNSSNGPPADFQDTFAVLSDKSRAYNDSLAKRDNQSSYYTDRFFGGEDENFQANFKNHYKDSAADYQHVTSASNGNAPPDKLHGIITEQEKLEALKEEAKRIEKFKEMKSKTSPARPTQQPSLTKAAMELGKSSGAPHHAATAYNKEGMTMSNGGQQFIKKNYGIVSSSSSEQPTPPIDIFDSLIAMSPPRGIDDNMDDLKSAVDKQKLNHILQLNNNFQQNQQQYANSSMPPMNLNANSLQNGYNTQMPSQPHVLGYGSSLTAGYGTPFHQVQQKQPQLPYYSNLQAPASSISSSSTTPKGTTPYYSKGVSPDPNNVNNKVIVKGDLESSLANLAASLNITHDQTVKKTTHQWVSGSSSNTASTNTNVSPNRQPSPFSTNMQVNWPVITQNNNQNQLSTPWSSNPQPFSTITNNNTLNTTNLGTSFNPFQQTTGPLTPLQPHQLTPQIHLPSNGSVSAAVTPKNPFTVTTTKSPPTTFTGARTPNYDISTHSVFDTVPSSSSKSANVLSLNNAKNDLFKSLDNLNVWPTSDSSKTIGNTSKSSALFASQNLLNQLVDGPNKSINPVTPFGTKDPFEAF